jgi:hypothetical protein
MKPVKSLITIIGSTTQAMTAGSVPRETGGVVVSTGASHKFELKLDTIRIRILDRFGEPHTRTTCDVNIAGHDPQQKVTNGKGWLELRCRPGVQYVDVWLRNVKYGDKRRVLLRPSWKNPHGIKERLANLGFYERKDEREDGRNFQLAHCLDIYDSALTKHIVECESDYTTLDNPLTEETSALDEPVHDLAETGERT